MHSREQPFRCSECDRTFPTKRHFVTHSKYHAGERPFICTECGESFAQKDHLVNVSKTIKFTVFHLFRSFFVCLGDAFKVSWLPRFICL